jgi:hypothetical protein
VRGVLTLTGPICRRQGERIWSEGMKPAPPMVRANVIGTSFCFIARVSQIVVWCGRPARLLASPLEERAAPSARTLMR